MLQENNGAAIEMFQVPEIRGLRKQFERMQSKMHGQQSTGITFTSAQQREMYDHCLLYTSGHGGQKVLDFDKTEERLMVLLDFLVSQGVPVPEVHPDIRCFSRRTKGLATRSIIAAYRQGHGKPVTVIEPVAPIKQVAVVPPNEVPLFLAPQLKGAFA